MRMSNWKGLWSERKFALASIALALLQIISFILARFLIKYSLVNSEPWPSPGVRGATIYRVLAGISVFGTALALISALLGIGLDSRRGLAFIALLISVLAFVFCAVQILV